MKLYGTSSIAFTTSSAPPAVAGYGGLFVSASSIYMIDQDSEIYDLTDSKGYMRIVEYTSSGFYSRPGNIAYIQVVCVGGGGGGGAGARNVTDANRGGGAGGSGGAVVQRWFNSSSLPSGIYTVTVGQGGNGGVTGSTAGTSAAGGNGGGGLPSSFTSGSVVFVRANGGVFGAGSSTAGTTTFTTDQYNAIVNTSASTAILAFPQHVLVGVRGGQAGVVQGTYKTPNSNANIATGPPIFAFAGGLYGSTVAPLQGFPGQTATTYNGGFYGIGGGGAGGHISSTNVSVNGGTGSAAYIWGSYTPTGSAGGEGIDGDNGAPRLVNGNFFIAFSSSFAPTASIGPGSPGHGGGPGDLAGTVNGGRGGIGGNYGAGGGGGGGATDPAQAGNGGAGATGSVIIFEWY